MGKASKSSRTWNVDKRGDGRPIALDLFSGCGGLTLGLKNADFYLQSESGPIAIEKFA